MSQGTSLNTFGVRYLSIRCLSKIIQMMVYHSDVAVLPFLYLIELMSIYEIE